MNQQLQNLSEIVNNEDFESLFSLTDNSDFSITLHEILVNRHDKKPDLLNQIQLNLFLCTHLENAGQADSVLSFLQEWFPEYKEQVITSLTEIGAVKSAEIIRQVVEILPKDGSWFFDRSDENSEKVLMGLEIEFSNYPDGPMKDLYRTYAEKYKDAKW